MAYGCNDPLRFARQAEAEAIMQGYMMPGTGLNGCCSIFSNPYVGYVPHCGNSVFNTPYYAAPCAGATVPAGMHPAPVGADTYAPAGATMTPQGQGMAAPAGAGQISGVDQADDGKISFGQKLKSFGKGLISPITNMFKSPGNFIKGALGIAVGAGLIAITGGAVAPIMVAAGVGFGGIQIAKGAIDAASAKTDAEAQQAWENMGSGTFAVAGSIAGAKAAAKASGVNTNGMNAFQATKECFTHGFSKTNLTKCWTTAKTNVVNFFKGNGTSAVKGKTSTETNTETKPNTEAKKPNDNTPEKPTDVDNADIKPKSKKEDVATEATTEATTETSTKATTETNIKTKKKTQTNSEGITP